MMMRTYGQYYPSGSYNPPQVYLNESSRAFLYLPNAAGDAVVVFDRIDAVDPRSQIGPGDTMWYHWNGSEIAPSTPWPG